MKRTLNLLLCAALALAMATPAAADDTPTACDVIVKNVSDYYLANASASQASSNARNYMRTMKSDGTWSDVDYADRSSWTHWSPLTHIDRLYTMVQAYCLPTSSLYADTALYNRIISGYTAFATKRPRPVNWYYEEVSWPTSVCKQLCEMRVGPRRVPASLENQLFTFMLGCSAGPAQSGTRGTAANKMMIAENYIMRNALQGNTSQLEWSLNQFFSPLQFNDGSNQRQGLQHDWIWLQHGPQLMTATYGGTVLSAITMFYVIKNTPYYDSYLWSIDHIKNFLLEARVPCVRGRYRSYNNNGRGMVGVYNDQGLASSLGDIIPFVDAATAQEMRQDSLRLCGARSASYNIKPRHWSYFSADYGLHQRPNYTMDVRMVSDRTYTCENGNGENLKGHFLAYGGTWMAVSGTEYQGIFPTWDWAHVPGVTAPALTRANIPLDREWGIYGTNQWAGGVSDSVYGAETFQMLDHNNGVNTDADKSYFFFDNEVVMLGKSIKSTNAAEVHTTVNQCNLSGNVTSLPQSGGGTQTLARGQHSLEGAQWVNHNGFTYYFPAGGDIVVRNDAQTGYIYDMTTASTDSTQKSRDVFRLWINHGTRPTNARYQYVVIPNTSSISAARRRLDSLTIVNNDTVQAVYNRTLGQVQAIFWQPGVLSLDSISINAKAPCALLFDNVSGESVKAYVSDPSHSRDSVRIYAKFPRLHAKQLDAAFESRELHLGATTAYTIDASTPDSIYVALANMTLDKHELNLDYYHLAQGLNPQTTPADAQTTYTWTSADPSVATVDAQGGVTAVASGRTTIVCRSLEGLTDSCVVNVEEGLLSIEPEADLYTDKQNPSMNYGNSTTLQIHRAVDAKQGSAAYIRFPFSSKLPAEAKTAAVLKSKLVASLAAVDSAYDAVSWDVYPLTATRWVETSYTFNNAATPAATVAKIAAIKMRGVSDTLLGNRLEFNVSSYTASRKSTAKLCFYLTQSTSNTDGTTQIYSREAADPTQRPRLVVYYTDVDAIHSIAADGGQAVDVYSLDGVLLRKGVEASRAADGLPRGIYIIGKKKVAVR